MILGASNNLNHSPQLLSPHPQPSIKLYKRYLPPFPSRALFFIKTVCGVFVNQNFVAKNENVSLLRLNVIVTSSCLWYENLNVSEDEPSTDNVQRTFFFQQRELLSV